MLWPPRLVKGHVELFLFGVLYDYDLRFPYDDGFGFTVFEFLDLEEFFGSLRPSGLS